MVIRSRINPEQYWTGTVTEIGTEAEQNSNNDMMYGSSSSDNTASKYAFYIVSDVIYRLDNTEHTSES